MKLYHVVYSGMVNVDVTRMCDDMVGVLETMIGTRFKNFVTETEVVSVDHAADIEDLINTLDDLQIPFAEGFHEQSGVYVVTTFTMKNVDSRNSTVLDCIRKVDSRRK